MKTQKRKGVILPTVMVAFIITAILFTVGLNNVPINAKRIKQVKETYDYKSVLSNFHQLSLAKVTQISKELKDDKKNFSDYFTNSEPTGGFIPYYNEFTSQLSKAIFSAQWQDVQKHTNTFSDHEMILQYIANSNSSDKFIQVFQSYIASLPERAEITSCESVLIKLDNSVANVWVVNRLRLVGGKSYFSAALINEYNHYNNDYFYFTESEGAIWFSDDDVINGPLASMDTIHITGNPEFNGTVYYNPEKGTTTTPGFRLYDDKSFGIFKGVPKTSPLPTDTSFAKISTEYQDQFKEDFVSFKSFFNASQHTVLEVNGLSANTGNFEHYSVNVPSTCTRLIVQTMGGSGDVDLYLRKNRNPTRGNYLRRSTGSTNNEEIELSNPSSGRYYIGLYRCHSPGDARYYTDVTLKVKFESSDSKTLFDFDNYTAYQSSIPVDDQINFNHTQALTLDYSPSNFEIDLEDNKIGIKWLGSNKKLEITYDKVASQESGYEATYKFKEGSKTYKIDKVPFSGFISSGNRKIYLGDHDNSNGGKTCYYKGKLTFQSTEKIFIEDNLVPSELKNINGLDLKISDYWDATQTKTVKEEFVKGNVDSSLNLVTDNNIFIGSRNYGEYYHSGEWAKQNQKIFASLFSFDENISVDGYNSNTLGYKGQLTIFGSLMQETRGAVGTFASKNENLFWDEGYYNSYNHSYSEYRYLESTIQKKLKYWDYSKGEWAEGAWHTVYTIPEDKRDICKYYINNDSYHQSVRVYYTTHKTVTGYDKNYYFDPRFNNGYTQAAGVPQSEGIKIKLSGNIEVY